MDTDDLACILHIHMHMDMHIHIHMYIHLHVHIHLHEASYICTTTHISI